MVLELGSGTGYDYFLAAKRVGETGRVTGVDMTPQMILQATQNAQRLNLSNIEFRLGYLEDLPVESTSVDLILSNCVINLAPDKAQVFKEAYCVLKPNGLLAITDMISLSELPPSLKQDVKAWAACIAGATALKDIETTPANGAGDPFPLFRQRESQGKDSHSGRRDVNQLGDHSAGKRLSSQKTISLASGNDTQRSIR